MNLNQRDAETHVALVVASEEASLVLPLTPARAARQRIRTAVQYVRRTKRLDFKLAG